MRRSLWDLCRRYRVQYVVAGPHTTGESLAALASLRWNTQKIDDVIIFTVPQFEPPSP